jgi:uncharacterized protein (DUF1697 family)
MGRRIVLLRGINLGPNRRVPMAELRELFSGAGFEDVRTYVQSGNVVVSDPADLADPADPGELEQRCERLIAGRFGFEVPVVVRTRDELAAVVERNPLGDVAHDPKRYQVSFLGAELEEGAVERLTELAAPNERVLADGRELYAWHPDGVARSKLWAKLAGTGLGVKATARNWTTVTTLLEMADA